MINRALVIGAAIMGLNLITGLGCGWVKQQPSGGAAPAFDFTTAGGTMILDFDPHTISGSDGDAITAYTDTSGSGNNLSQGTAINQPTLKKGANGLNSRNIATFDGNDRLAASSSVINLANKLTYYVVARVASASNAIVFSTLNGTNGDLFRFHNDAGTINVQHYAPLNRVNPSVIANQWAIYTVIVRATTGGNGTVTIRKNGATLATTAPDARNPSHEGFLTLGACPDATLPLTGAMARVMLYDGEHNATQYAAVEAALNGLFAVY
jgi:hypothetical protein